MSDQQALQDANDVTITHWHEPGREDTSPFVSIQASVMDSPISLTDKYLFAQAANPARVDLTHARNVPAGAALISRNRVRGDARGDAVVGSVVPPAVRRITPQQQSESVAMWQHRGEEGTGNSDGAAAADGGGRRQSKFHDASIEQIMQSRQQSVQAQATQPPARPAVVPTTNATDVPQHAPQVPSNAQQPQKQPPPTQVSHPDPPTNYAKAMLRLQEEKPLAQALDPIEAVNDQYKELEQHMSQADIDQQKRAWIFKYNQLCLRYGLTCKNPPSMADDLGVIRFMVLSTQKEVYIRNGVERTKKFVRGPVKFAKAMSDLFMGHVLDLDGTRTEGGISLMDSVDETLDNSERDLEIIVNDNAALDVRPTKQQAMSNLGMSLLASVGDVLMSNNCERVIGAISQKLNLGPAKAKKDKEEKKRLKKQKREEEEALARKKAIEDAQLMFYRSMPPPQFPYPSPMQMPSPTLMPMPSPQAQLPFHYYVPQPYASFIPPQQMPPPPQQQQHQFATPFQAQPFYPSQMPPHQQQQQPLQAIPAPLPPVVALPSPQQQQQRQQPTPTAPPPAATPAPFSLVPPVGANTKTPAHATTSTQAPPRRKFPTLNMPAIGTPTSSSKSQK